VKTSALLYSEEVIDFIEIHEVTSRIVAKLHSCVIRTFFLHGIIGKPIKLQKKLIKPRFYPKNAFHTHP